jgi:hypothetical protein
MWEVDPKILISILADCSLSRGQWAVGSRQCAVGSAQWAVGSGPWAVEEDVRENHKAQLALVAAQDQSITV